MAVLKKFNNSKPSYLKFRQPISLIQASVKAAQSDAGMKDVRDSYCTAIPQYHQCVYSTCCKYRSTNTIYYIICGANTTAAWAYLPICMKPDFWEFSTIPWQRLAYRRISALSWKFTVDVSLVGVLMPGNITSTIISGWSRCNNLGVISAFCAWDDFHPWPMKVPGFSNWNNYLDFILHIKLRSWCTY